MSDIVRNRMDLSRVKAFLNSLPNIEFLSEIDESIDVSILLDTHTKMLNLSNEPTQYIPINSPKSEIDRWLLSGFNLFNLENSFYVRTDDFLAAPWVRVETLGNAEDWLIPLYHGLTSGRVQFTPLDLGYVFEFRQQEHRFSTFIAKVEASPESSSSHK